MTEVLMGMADEAAQESDILGVDGEARGQADDDGLLDRHLEAVDVVAAILSNRNTGPDEQQEEIQEVLTVADYGTASGRIVVFHALQQIGVSRRAS